MKFNYSFDPKRAGKYSMDKGYGFSTSPNPSIGEDLRDSWPGDYFFTSVPTLLMDVPNGNYKVKLTLGSSDQSSSTTIKEGLGHLKICNVETKPGEFLTSSFSVHIDHGQLKLAFGGISPKVEYVEVERVLNTPTIFLAGDSTVTDQASGQFPYTGWGQMLSLFLNDNITVANHARSGRSSKSFIDESRLNRISKKICKGDYLFIQFAHNDEKDNEGGTKPFTSYQSYLKKYIHVAREVGAYPVIISAMHRRFFDDAGKIINTHGEYIEASHQLSLEEKVPFVDLASLSKSYYEGLGLEDSKQVFLWAKPGQYKNLPEGAEDNTHFSEEGAIEIARLVAEAIYKAEINPLQKYLIPKNKIKAITTNC